MRKKRGRTKRINFPLSPHFSLRGIGEIWKGKQRSSRYNDQKKRKQNIQSENPLFRDTKALCQCSPPPENQKKTWRQPKLTASYSAWFLFFFHPPILSSSLSHKNKCHHALSLSEDLVAQASVSVISSTCLLSLTLFSLRLEFFGQTGYKRDCDTVRHNANWFLVPNAASRELLA